MRLKTSIALSLALLMGTAPSFTEAAPRKSTPTKPSKKKKTPETPPPDAPVNPEPQVTAPVVPPEPAFTPPPAPPAVSPQAPWAGRVVVFAVPRQAAAAGASARLEEELRLALGAETNLQWMDPAALFAPPEPDPLTKGETLFKEGKELYDNLDTEAAAKKFAEAADFYREHAADAKPEQLARAYIFLGATRMLNGDNPGGQEAFTRALLAAPTLRPETGLFGQDVHDAYAAAKNSLSRQAKGTLAIDSVPAGAKVAVHGERMGTTPIKDVELAPGAHQVVLTLPGHATLGIFQDVTSGQRAEMKPNFEPLPALASVRTLASQVASDKKIDADKPPAGVGSLAQQLEARYVVIAVMEQEGKGRSKGTLYAWDTKSKNRLSSLKFNPAEARDQQEAVTQVHDFLTGKPVASSSLSLPPVMKKPWFWATVGGVAAATTAGVLLATQPTGKLVGTRLGNFGAGW